MGQWKPFYRAVLIITFVAYVLGLAFVLITHIGYEPKDVYQRIEACVAMEVYTRAECVIIESAR
jgi:hypothetical protein